MERAVAMQAFMSQPERKSVWLAHEAPVRLAELGLEVQNFHDALGVGDAARKRVDGGRYPRNYPGIVMWAESLAALRSILHRKRQGWQIGRTGNYETIYSRSAGIAIALQAADRWTGVDEHHNPRLKRRRGPKTTERVERNLQWVQIALDLGIGPEVEIDQEDALDEDIRTYFLLTYPKPTEIAIELSLPIYVGKDGYVQGWGERILMQPVPITGAIAPIAPDEDDDNGDDVGKIVKRRS